MKGLSLNQLIVNLLKVKKILILILLLKDNIFDLEKGV